MVHLPRLHPSQPLQDPKRYPYILHLNLSLLECPFCSHTMNSMKYRFPVLLFEVAIVCTHTHSLVYSPRPRFTYVADCSAPMFAFLPLHQQSLYILDLGVGWLTWAVRLLQVVSAWWGNRIKALQREAGLSKKHVSGMAVLEAVPGAAGYWWPTEAAYRHLGSGGQGYVC